MSKTVQINPLLVLISILVAASIGSWIGGLFGGFVAALLAIPAAGAGQVIVSELWRDTAPAAPAGPPVSGAVATRSGAEVAGSGPGGGGPVGAEVAGTEPASVTKPAN